MSECSSMSACLQGDALLTICQAPTQPCIPLSPTCPCLAGAAVADTAAAAAAEEEEEEKEAEGAWLAGGVAPLSSG